MYQRLLRVAYLESLLEYHPRISWRRHSEDMWEVPSFSEHHFATLYLRSVMAFGPL